MSALPFRGVTVIFLLRFARVVLVAATVVFVTYESEPVLAGAALWGTLALTEVLGKCAAFAKEAGGGE